MSAIIANHLRPRHLRPRREKIFGPAPEHRLDGNAKARVWAAAGAYNAANRQPRQHWGPLTRATMSVLKALLWRFHGADGGGRCFPGYERIAAVAKCHRDTVCEALKALEQAGILTWVNRITRIRRRERDLFGAWGSVWQVIRISNGYIFRDPLDCQPGRKGYKSENPARPLNPEEKEDGARLDGARVMSEGSSPAPPVPAEPPAVALRHEQAAGTGSPLSSTERAAIETRMNKGIATRADREAWNRDLDARIALLMPMC